MKRKSSHSNARSGHTDGTRGSANIEESPAAAPQIVRVKTWPWCNCQSRRRTSPTLLGVGGEEHESVVPLFRLKRRTARNLVEARKNPAESQTEKRRRPTKKAIPIFAPFWGMGDGHNLALLRTTASRSRID